MSELVAVCLSGIPAIVLMQFDPRRGELRELERAVLPNTEGSTGMMPMSISADGKSLHVAWRGHSPRVFSFGIDRLNGTVSARGSAAQLNMSACYLSSTHDSSRLLAASYLDSKIAVLRVRPDGAVSEPINVLEAPNAHCIIQGPGELVYVTSLKGNFVQAYQLDHVAGTLLPRRRTATFPGPRHLEFSSDGRWAYLISEFVGAVASYRVDSDDGGLTEANTTFFADGVEKPWAAEIRLRRDRFLVVSERRTSRLVAYQVGPDGAFQQSCSVDAPDCPRAFDIDSSGRFLFAAGEKSGELWIYSISVEGALELVSKQALGPQPSWVTPLF